MAFSKQILVFSCAAAVAVLGGVSAYFGMWSILFGALAGAVCILRFQQLHLTVIILVFLFASTVLPGARSFTSGRWLALGIATAFSLFVWVANRGKLRFGLFHAFAGFAVATVLISTANSVSPLLTFYKAAAFACLLVYAGIGARLSVAGHEKTFIEYLTVSCGLLTCLLALSVFVFHYNPFFNPNNLGAAMSVLVWPLLFCRVVSQRLSWKTLLNLVTAALCLGLIVQSRSRASLVAAIIAAMVILYAFRYTRTLGAAGIAVGISLAVLFFYFPQTFRLLAVQVVYKGDVNSQSATSRQGPWEEDIAKIKESPWLGSGFGASRGLSEWWTGGFESWEYDREKGSSYLALLEGLGIIGSIPFVLLLGSIIYGIYRACNLTRSGGQLLAIPIAGLLSAGLANAFFEGWLIAPGYYLAVIFWISAFALSDVLAQPAASRAFLKVEPQSRPVLAH